MVICHENPLAGLPRQRILVSFPLRPPRTLWLIFSLGLKASARGLAYTFLTCLLRCAQVQLIFQRLIVHDDRDYK
ncbi:MAG: hypothetical protein ACI9OU_002752 [Candidatus Promineifilaceae bacterium]|jgi:hypothetical protein